MPIADRIEAENAISVMTQNTSIPFGLAFDSSNRVATLTFSSDLKPDTKYSVSMRETVKTIEDQDIAQFGIVNFTTLPDITIDFTVPVNKQDVGVDTSIVFNLSPNVDWEDAHKSLISILNYDDQPVDFNVHFTSSTGALTITPVADLQYNMSYTIAFREGLRNKASNQKLIPCSFSFKTNNKVPVTGAEPEHVVASITVTAEDYIDSEAVPPIINLGARFVVDFKNAPRDLHQAENAIKIYSIYEEATKYSAEWSEDKTKLTFTISANMASATIRVAFIGDIYDSRNVLIDPFEELRFETTPYAGEGTEENPYQVFLPIQLDLVRQNLSAHYKQMNDIDLTGYVSNFSESYEFTGFIPIGNFDLYTGDPSGLFTGTYDGQDYKITGFWQDMPSGYMLTGLFGGLYGPDACIKNVHLDNPDGSIKGYYYMGSIAGAVFGGSIINCSNNIPMESVSLAVIGGIAGFVASDCIIDHCVNNAKLTGTSMTECIGGIVAGVEGCDVATISNCINNGDIINTAGYAAGIISVCSYANDYITIINCKNTGNISTPFAVSCGIANQLDSANIISCSNTGDLSGMTACGIGYDVDYSVIDKCYNTGNINTVAGGNSSCGLFSGAEYTIISNCYNTGDIIGEYAYGMFDSLYSDCELINCYTECSVIALGHESDEIGARSRTGVFGRYIEGSSRIKDCFATKKSVYNNITDITTDELWANVNYDDHCDNTYILNNGFSDEITATSWSTDSTWNDSSVWILNNAKLPELVPYTE